jgi:hypothetical protein
MRNNHTNVRFRAREKSWEWAQVGVLVPFNSDIHEDDATETLKPVAKERLLVEEQAIGRFVPAEASGNLSERQSNETNEDDSLSVFFQNNNIWSRDSNRQENTIVHVWNRKQSLQQLDLPFTEQEVRRCSPVNKRPSPHRLYSLVKPPQPGPTPTTTISIPKAQ